MALWVTIADDAYLKIISSPMKHGVNQIPVIPLPRLSTTALPREMFKVPEDAIALLCCSFPFFRINVTTSTSLWVWNTVSSCCCDGWRSLPWAPWPEWKTVYASYRKKGDYECQGVMKKKKLHVQATMSVSAIELSDHVKFKVLKKRWKAFTRLVINAG